MRSRTVCILAAGSVILGAAIAWASGLWSGAEPPTRDPAAGPAISALAPPERATANDGTARATFGNGCFWCTEAVFQQVPGVRTVVSGYSGGTVKNPTYRQVCSGTTGHAEAIHITYDPEAVQYPKLLEVFWKTHDPTTRNRQGNDVGTQYRSVVFFHTDEQRELAETYKRKLDESGAFAAPIVTEVVAFNVFYPAEEYHQNYYRQHENNRYCRTVIVPKLEKLEQVFKR